MCEEIEGRENEMGTMMTTLELTETAGKHIVKAIRKGLGVNAQQAQSILDIHIYHLPFISEGEDLRGIEAVVRRNTPIGTADACFDLFLDGNWKGAFRTGSVRTRRENLVDEAMHEAMSLSTLSGVRGAVAGLAPKVDHARQREERRAQGRLGEIVGTVWDCEQHPMNPSHARIDVRSDDGETYVLAVMPILGNTPAQNMAFAREKIGKRMRICWLRVPEFCEDYQLAESDAAGMEDEMVVDFFLDPPYRALDTIASSEALIEGAAIRESRDALRMAA